MYFFDYGNAFLLEVSRAGGDVFIPGTQRFKYNSYVQDILGPMCFDYGFGPFRWICTSGAAEDLAKTDAIALEVLETMAQDAPTEILGQLKDNIDWIRDAANNNLVVGSQARILYADAEGRITIARAINAAVRSKEITAPVVLGRDHHDVSGTDSPYRETSNIYDGSKFTADMAVHNFVGDAFSQETKDAVKHYIQHQFGGKIDLIIYSLASGARMNPTTQTLVRSTLKAIGEPVKGKTIDIAELQIKDIIVPAATEQEIVDTVYVMGGSDWMDWVQQSIDANLLNQGAKAISYTYIGSKNNAKIYREGTIGRAKDDLEMYGKKIDALLKSRIQLSHGSHKNRFGF